MRDWIEEHHRELLSVVTLLIVCLMWITAEIKAAKYDRMFHQAMHLAEDAQHNTQGALRVADVWKEIASNCSR
jgi:hypothetical protein